MIHHSWKKREEVKVTSSNQIYISAGSWCPRTGVGVLKFNELGEPVVNSVSTRARELIIIISFAVNYRFTVTQHASCRSTKNNPNNIRR